MNIERRGETMLPTRILKAIVFTQAMWIANIIAIAVEIWIIQSGLVSGTPHTIAKAAIPVALIVVLYIVANPTVSYYLRVVMQTLGMRKIWRVVTFIALTSTIYLAITLPETSHHITNYAVILLLYTGALIAYEIRDQPRHYWWADLFVFLTRLSFGLNVFLIVIIFASI